MVPIPGLRSLHSKHVSKAALGQNGHRSEANEATGGAIRGHRVVRKFIYLFIPQIFIEYLLLPGTLGADILVK